MAQHLHLFETVSAFTEQYNGEGYKEPWVSYTEENRKVDYNRIPGLTLVNNVYCTDEETEEIIVCSSYTVTAKNFEMSCEELMDFTLKLDHDMKFRVHIYDRSGTEIVNYHTNDVLGTPCERCNALYNKNGIQLYDSENGRFFETIEDTISLDGATVVTEWYNEK